MLATKKARAWATRRWTLFSMLAIACLGCAVNDHGLVRVRRFENDTSYLVCVESFGAHLTTQAGDAGITFGYSRRSYVFARDGGAAALDPSQIAAASQRRLQESPCLSCPTLRQLGTPLFRTSATIGASLDANRDRVGFALGFRRQAALQIPRDRSMVLLLRYDSNDEPSTEVIIGKEIEE